ncbi:MAG: PEP-CTERM sorting domain-containing protein [Pseudomonadales bacterium]|jgi:hypothetical protein|nr:PEP-CTERM sorting domain-containing protein [Pseudomonadales bacterium]
MKAVRKLTAATPAFAATGNAQTGLTQITNPGTATLGTIPGGAKNDVLGTGGQVQGYYNANLGLTGPALLTFECRGFEAGWVNTFETASGSFLNKGTGSSTLGDTFAALNDIAFSFCTNQGSGDPRFCVENGFNNPNGGSEPLLNFFVSFGTDRVGNGGGDAAIDDDSPTHGNVVWLYFDDGGAGNDDNHDDLAVKITARAVPEAASWALIAAGLAGLGIRRRRRRSWGRRPGRATRVRPGVPPDPPRNRSGSIPADRRAAVADGVRKAADETPTFHDLGQPPAGKAPAEFRLIARGVGGPVAIPGLPRRCPRRTRGDP